MEKILAGLDWPQDPNLLVGLESRDDAGVYRLNDQLALIYTVDFLTPMVDDPYIFGQIAAVNALNDVYAMGGQPLLAMNVVCFPQCEDMEVLGQILAGGLSKVKEAGALIVGGHTVDDLEPKYGLAVCGTVHPDRVIRNSTAKPGEMLFLTKPLGSGIIATAIKAGMASAKAIEEAVQWMSRLNRQEALVMQSVGISAATDITGFGLMGHLHELAEASGVSIEISASKLRFMEGASEYANMGLIPAGAYHNRDYLADKIEFSHDLDPDLCEMVCSPETAGGLIMSAAEDKTGALQKAMLEQGCTCYPIGKIVDDGFRPIIIKP